MRQTGHPCPPGRASRRGPVVLAVALTGCSTNRFVPLAGQFGTLTRDAAEQQRRDMVGDVAHELRNPLTNIRGWIEAAGYSKARDLLILTGPEPDYRWRELSAGSRAATRSAAVWDAATRDLTR